MFVSFSLDNSDSFKNESEIKMEATSIKAHDTSLLKRGGRKFLPVLAIYGANASGKTNLLSSMLGLFGRIVDRTDFYYEGFLFGDTTNDVTKLKLSCVIDDMEYQLTVHIDNGLFNEYVYESFAFRKSKDKDFFNIYERTWDNEWHLKCGSSSHAKSFKEEVNYVHKMEKSNWNLLITSLGKREKSNCFGRYFDWVNKSLGLSTANEVNKIAAFSAEDINIGFFKDMGKKKALHNFIRKINPMIKDIDIVEDKQSHSYEYVVSYKKDIAWVNGYRLESLGTKKAIQLYPAIHQILNSGGLFVIDEIENSLHPLLVARIIGLFTNPETNPGEGQLIFTSHNPLIMDKKYLRADEIWFVDKDGDGVSTLTQLADYNVRSDLDFCKNYILGAFKGIPVFPSNEEADDGDS